MGVTGCVSSVVLGPGMMCPYVIGRDSWDRGGQESVVRPDFNSPQDLGEEALTERTRLTVETDFPDNLVIVVVVAVVAVVVECYCFLINIIVVVV